MLPDKAYRKVPIAVFHGEQINGSLNITKHLCMLHGWNAAKQLLSKNNHKEKGRLLDSEESAILWAHDSLVPIFPACMYESLKDCWSAARHICATSNFTALEKTLVRLGAPPVLYYVGKKLQKKHGIDDPVQALHARAGTWIKKIKEKNGEGKTFHGGEDIDMADVVVYGFLRALRVCPTLQTIRDDNEEFNRWYTEVEKQLEQRSPR